MDTNTLIKEALNLRPADRMKLMDVLAQSLDKSDIEIDNAWAEEAERRYLAYKEGRVKVIGLDEVINRYR